MEKVKMAVKAIVVSIVIGWLFYQRIWAVVIMIPFAGWFYKNLMKEKIEQKQGMFLLQFKEMTECIANALNVGYSAENAFKEAQKEMRIVYMNRSMINDELDLMVRKIRLQIPLEQVLEDFAGRVELEDVKNFAVVFSAAKRSGGDMIAIIHNTAVQIGEKIDVQREISIILASKKYEFRIMCVIPFAMIFYMQLSFPQFMSVLYGNAVGIGVMTICLAGYIFAYVLGAKLIKIEV